MPEAERYELGLDIAMHHRILFLDAVERAGGKIGLDVGCRHVARPDGADLALFAQLLERAPGKEGAIVHRTDLIEIGEVLRHVPAGLTDHEDEVLVGIAHGELGPALDRLSPEGAETRMLDHAAYLVRDGLAPVSGMDESGELDAMSLAWMESWWQDLRFAVRSLARRPRFSFCLVVILAVGLGLTVSIFSLVRGMLFLPEVNDEVVVAFGQILPVPLLESLPHGFVNVHYSLLPRWRGAAHGCS